MVKTKYSQLAGLAIIKVMGKQTPVGRERERKKEKKKALEPFQKRSISVPTHLRKWSRGRGP